MNLKEKAKHLPTSPGVYLMKDSTGQIIYVGKAKNLKNRVLSYFQNSKNHTKKVEKMVNHLKNFDFIVTDTEFEAFMLECHLIKKWQPLYNKLMKSPQSYIYLVIQRKKESYELTWSNQYEETDGNLYFGPFTSKGSVERAIQGLKDFYKLDCSNLGNTPSPCLNYTLGKCIGICFDNEARKEYDRIIEKIIALLGRKDLHVVDEIEQEMTSASVNFDFERAAELRDTLVAIKALVRREKMIEFAEEGKDIVVVEPIENGKLKVFLINRNQILFHDLYDMENSDIDRLFKSIKNHILTHFTADKLLHPSRISKEEIDEAHIIYRYLESGTSKYTFIPSDLFSEENEKLLDKKIWDFLQTKVFKEVKYV